jgi:hypothetical protein
MSGSQLISFISASYIDVTRFRDWIKEVQNGLISPDLTLVGDEKMRNKSLMLVCNIWEESINE